MCITRCHKPSHQYHHRRPVSISSAWSWPSTIGSYSATLPTAICHLRVVGHQDEAHLLVPDQLEELRLLTNAEMDSRSPFALLLVRQPTLARQLRLGVFAALDQRIATRYQLAPMDLAEVAQYLRHHLALVGRTDPLFADDAIARLHKLSLGLPRAQQRRDCCAHRRGHRRQSAGRRRVRQENRWACAARSASPFRSERGVERPVERIFAGRRSAA
jgi:hypothetical protein